MFTLLFSKKIVGHVLDLKVCGIKSDNNIIVWDTPIEYILAKHFVDGLNERDMPEEDLFDVTHEFLIAIQ